MPLKDSQVEREAFFVEPTLDLDLPFVNRVFWSSLIKHIEQDCVRPPRAIVDIGCHTGGLLYELNRQFAPAQLIGIEPMAAARATAARLLTNVAAEVTLLDESGWDRIPVGSIDLITSHETLYLEADLQSFMSRLRRILASGGAAYVVLGCHSENPLWETWKVRMIAAGHSVFSHAPIQIMEAAASAGFLPAVQPLRRAGWITYDPRGAEFPYPDARTMLDHHYRHKLIFRMRIADVPTATS